jgi:hypothetical protein
MIDLTRFRTDSRTSKFWITPENATVALDCWHYEYFRDPAISRKYGVPFGPEVPTRLAALRVGFVRGNYERNGARLTLETMRHDRLLRKLIDALVLANADALDLVRLHTVDREGQALSVAVAPLHQKRQYGQPINRATLGSWSYSREIKAPGAAK